MTTPPTNPPSDTPAPPGRALRIARLVIALGLIVGVGVFGVLAINELAQGQAAPRTAEPDGFGASDGSLDPDAGHQRLPGDLVVPPGDPLLGLTRSPNRIPIDHHPGGIPPFMNAAPYEQVPYRQPVVDGLVWESCVYQVNHASADDAIAHYEREAAQRGLAVQRKRQASDQLPGGMVIAWSNGSETLQLTTRPMPIEPPMRPALQWVVQYSYPVPAR